MTDPQGFWPDSWQPLAEAFAANFADCGEEGAALAVVQGGGHYSQPVGGHS